MKHALKYFSSRNVPSLRPNGVCFLTQSGKNIVLLKWKMTTMKNDVLSFTLHCCPITFSSARTNLCNIGMFRVPPVTYLLYQKVCEHFLNQFPMKISNFPYKKKIIAYLLQYLVCNFQPIHAVYCSVCVIFTSIKIDDVT